MVTGTAESSHLSRRQKPQCEFQKSSETSRPTPSNTPPSIRTHLLILSKEYYHLGSKHSSIRASGGHSNHHSRLFLFTITWNHTFGMSHQKIYGLVIHVFTNLYWKLRHWAENLFWTGLSLGSGTQGPLVIHVCGPINYCFLISLFFCFPIPFPTVCRFYNTKSCFTITLKWT